MLKNRLFDIVLVLLALMGVFCLLVIFLQPTNVIVNDESTKSKFMHLFGWVGILLSIPVAFYLVNPMAGYAKSKIGEVFHQIGVWMTRSFVVFTLYLLFAYAGHTIPAHIVNLNASDAYTETVKYGGFKLSSDAYGQSYTQAHGGKFNVLTRMFHNEFIIVRREYGNTIALLINNWYGTNKLNFTSLMDWLVEDRCANRHELSGTNGACKIQLSGRRHSLGITYDRVHLN